VDSKVLSADERRQLLLSVGTHRGRRPLSPVEVAGLFGKIMQSGGTLTECARAASLEGTTWVSRFLRLSQLPATVQHLVDWGSGAGILGFTAATELGRLGESSDQEAVVQAVLVNRLSGSEVRQIVQLRRRSHRPIGECVAEVLGMRPKIEKRFVYVGAIEAPEPRETLASMHQLARDQLLRSVLKEILGDTDITVARLGGERFTLAGGTLFGEAIARKEDMLEREVNERLRRGAS
jgi:hypothetical protein